ncbi:MAG: hypothetical protein A3I61_09285 [Acidobacteria bacterium RIFCSPLOWO2_02_FULL_68_18]|nr:MAG: hypothetical protein A3I61_09285 [Acidobacteria bacterium RIFCSPLOWO2_02_FULL_68_18]OFW51099.1 MAG: hypothetical protein A3G77_15865 [Acidobacteria bacterium RIFCSPLOWO2_12_FULL_68_19]
MLRRFLHRCGLVTRGELHVAEEKLRAARQRLEKVSERLAQATGASERLQQAQRESAERYKTRLAELESEHERRATRAREAAAEASERIATLEQELRRRDAETETETLLERRVTTAMHELQVAREALASVDVKLDILEGAANMLDRRMRPGRSVEPDDRS